MTEIKIRLGRSEYQGLITYSPKVSVDNYLTLECYECEFLSKLSRFVEDYCRRKEDEND